MWLRVKKRPFPVHSNKWLSLVARGVTSGKEKVHSWSHRNEWLSCRVRHDCRKGKSPWNDGLDIWWCVIGGKRRFHFPSSICINLSQWLRPHKLSIVVLFIINIFNLYQHKFFFLLNTRNWLEYQLAHKTRVQLLWSIVNYFSLFWVFSSIC